MTKPAEKAQWIRVAEQFEPSGLTQRAFAQQQALPLSTLQSWVYRRRRQEAGAQASARTPAAGGAELRALQRSLGRVEVLTRSGVRVSFEMGTDVAYVARLVAALERAAC